MRLLFIFTTFIFLFATFAVGGALYKENNTQDIYNLTQNLNWNASNFELEEFDNLTGLNASQINSIRLKNVINKGVDTFGFMMFEVAKWGVETGFGHPEWNYIFIAKVVVIILLIALFLPFIKVLPTLLALSYLLVYGIHWLSKKIFKKKGGKK